MPTPLMTYLNLQRALDTDVLTMLAQTALSVQTELDRLTRRVGIGAEVRSYQLSGTQAAINREMARYWERVGNTTAAAQLNAAAEAAEQVLASSGLIDRIADAADVEHMIVATRAQAEKGLETAMERISESSYIPLAESVYDNAALSSGKIDEIVTTALARGSSAEELADAVYDYVNPNTPGGARYASMRLARTELNNAFHASSVRQAQSQPWTTSIDWNLSGSHPVPDECNTYAEQVHFNGGEPGQFRPEEVPAKPHPNCLCYTTTNDMDPDEFINRYFKGEFDDHLDQTFPDLPSRQPPPPSALPDLPGSRAAGLSGNTTDVKVLDGSDWNAAWQTWQPGAARAEMLWTENIDNISSIRRILENRDNGLDDMDGVALQGRNFDEYLVLDIDDEDLFIYDRDDLAADFRAAADHIQKGLANPQEFGELFRGMNLADRDLFEIGDTVEGITSWSGQLGWAQRYAVEGGNGDGWPVIMVVKNARGMRLSAKEVTDIYTHDEHLLRGAFKVTGKRYDGDFTILEVTYAP